MPRYIDANEFRNRIDHYPPDIRDIAKKELRYTPTADVVEVVRCKDCKHYYNSDEMCEMIASRLATFMRDDIHWNDEFYCAFGERIEE